MFNKKGQNIAEYSILIALVVAAAVAMQIYVRRGLQGRVADAVDHAPQTDDVGGSPIQFNTKQYEPYYTDSSGEIVSNRDANEAVNTRGQTARTGIDESTTRRRGAYEEQQYQGENAR
jgi:hypothetical protein